MSATIRYVGGPYDGQTEVSRGIPDHITHETGVYWLKKFSGNSATMVWREHKAEPPATETDG